MTPRNARRTSRKQAKRTVKQPDYHTEYTSLLRTFLRATLCAKQESQHVHCGLVVFAMQKNPAILPEIHQP
jgi:hypothetical protein